MDRETLIEVIEAVAQSLPETADLFDIDPGDTELMEAIGNQAREIMLLRNLQSLQQASELQQAAASRETRTRELEDETRRDGLTRLFNGRHFDRMISEEFEAAARHDWPAYLTGIRDFGASWQSRWCDRPQNPSRS